MTLRVLAIAVLVALFSLVQSNGNVRKEKNVRKECSKNVQSRDETKRRYGGNLNTWLSLLNKTCALNTQVDIPFDGRAQPEGYTGCRAMHTVCSEEVTDTAKPCKGDVANLFDALHDTTTFRCSETFDNISDHSLRLFQSLQQQLKRCNHAQSSP